MSSRRHLLALAFAALAGPRLVGCAARPREADAAWEGRLQGRTVALLGEVHDNAALHRLRAESLERALAAGWRPAIVMEQFDLDRQDDLERSRREHPRDTQRLIDAAAGEHSGWEWVYYQPVLALALAYDLPLLAGNLSRRDAARVMREGAAAALGEARARALGLLDPIDPMLLAAQERAVDAGHCGALPPALLPGMAEAQLARDAVMAAVVREHADNGVVLLAGDGHVRRDLGVPRWLANVAAERILSIGFIEDADVPIVGRYDAIVIAAPAPRADPCREFVAPSLKRARLDLSEGRRRAPRAPA